MFTRPFLHTCILFSLVCVSLLSFSAVSQTPVLDERGLPTGLINMNPDPNGEPWIAGGITRDQWEKATANLPQLKLSPRTRAAAPDKVDNSALPAFRPIFSQKGGSCAQASAVGYVFTYEINAMRGLSADVLEHQYPYDFTYNFCNSGSGSRGSMPNQGFDIGVRLGIPDAETYGGFGLGEHDRWVSGYDVYYSGMANRASEQFTIDVGDAAGVNEMREWLDNHGDGSDQGGCLVFCYNSSGCKTETLEDGTPEAGKEAIVMFGDGGGHSVTIAGYNDSVRYDYNGDGRYTNDVDLDGDGKVGVEDWEIGAVIMVNSWGTRFGDDGRIYVMYRMCAHDDGIWSSRLYGIRTQEEFVQPLLTYKSEIEHNERGSLRLRAYISNNVNATEPDNTRDYVSWGKAFNRAGGDFPMGGEDGPSAIEIGLDVTPLLDDMTGDEARLFLEIDSDGGSGTVNSFSVIDYSSGSPVETECDEQNVDIPGNETTYLSVVFSRSPTSIAHSLPEASQFNITNSGSRILYQIPEEVENSTVYIALYSTQGKRVKEITRHNPGTGQYSIDLHENLAAGTYLCRMEAAGFTKMTHVIVTK